MCCAGAFQPDWQPRARHHGPVTVSSPPHLTILPGSQQVLFLVELDQAATLLAWRACRFLEGLKATTDLLGFAELQRDEDPPDELLHWSGNV